MRNLSRFEWYFDATIRNSVPKLKAAMRALLTKHCLEQDAFIICNDWSTLLPYSTCNFENSLDHMMVTRPLTAIERVITFLRCLQRLYMLPNRKD